MSISSQVEDKRRGEFENKKNSTSRIKTIVICLVIGIVFIGAIIEIFFIDDISYYMLERQRISDIKDSIAAIENDNYEDAEWLVYSVHLRNEEVEAQLKIYSDAVDTYYNYRQLEFDGCEVGQIYRNIGPFDDHDTIWGFVADKSEDKVLMIVVIADSFMPYSLNSDDTSWANSEIRKWLNEDVLNDILAKSVGVAVVPTEVSTGDEITNDYLFLLSTEEAEKYMPTIKECWTDGRRKCWLRDSSIESSCVSYFTESGDIDTSGKPATDKALVCAAMWVETDLQSSDFYEEMEIVKLNELIDKHY